MKGTSHLSPPPPLPLADRPNNSPYTLCAEQITGQGGFPAGPDLSCKKMTHLLRENGAKGRRGSSMRENINRNVSCDGRHWHAGNEKKK